MPLISCFTALTIWEESAGETVKMQLDNKNLDFCFENSLVKVVANRNYPEVELAGLTVGPFEEGNEYEL
jgi:hypothetical protein